ncbi:subtilisin-like serine protease [Chytridiales sp. JEL 0842]|nr:subtilisin-like serine protease [Chytridiales sp. JEL 0842]
MQLLSIIILALSACNQLVAAAPAVPKHGDPIPNQYIIVFKNTTEPARLKNHQRWLDQTARIGTMNAPTLKRIDGSDFPEIKNPFDAFNFLYKYDYATERGAFKGYAARLSDDLVETLKGMPEVAYIEQDTVVTAYGGPWWDKFFPPLPVDPPVNQPRPTKTSSTVTSAPRPTPNPVPTSATPPAASLQPSTTTHRPPPASTTTILGNPITAPPPPPPRPTPAPTTANPTTPKPPVPRPTPSPVAPPPASSTGTQARGAPWGLRRLNNPSLPLPTTYTYPQSAGENVDVYIIDSGVRVSHPDFEGRAQIGASFSDDGNDIDGNGHGTHVAGTVAGKTFGVAKKANIIAVKVLGTSGSGSNSDVIAGVNWVAQQAARTGRKSVANMSLGGSANTALDNAVGAAVRSGVTFVVAAGNDGRDACTNSPARARSAITVGASDINDRLASFSNRGTCVDVIAPGVNILSTWNDGRTNAISGTSMASPHVAGIVAVAMSEGKVTTPESAMAYLTNGGVEGKISGVPSNTRNLLVQL